MISAAGFQGRSRDALVAAACAAWWLGVLVFARGGSPQLLSDAWEYALFARHLFEGWGFRTIAIHPPLWPLHDERLSVPMLVHGPMLPGLIAPFLLISREAAIAAIPWIAALFASLAGGVLFRLATRAVGGAAAAAVVVLFTLSPLAVHCVLSDPSFAVGAFWSVLALERLGAGRPLQAGLSCGAGALVRPEFVLIAPLLALAAPGSRLRLAGGFLLPWLPWAWRQTAVSGVPAFNLSSYLLLAFTPAHPDLSVLRSFDIGIDRFRVTLLAELPGLWSKWLHAAPRALKHLLTAPGLATGWLAIVAVLGAGRGALAPLPAGGRVVFAMLVPLLLMVVAQHRPEFVMTLLPLWAMTAVLGARWLAGTRAIARRGVWLAALVVVSIPGAWNAVRDQAVAARIWRQWLGRERDTLTAYLGPRPAGHAPETIVFTDAPGFVAWTTGRTTAWVTRSELERHRADAAEERGALPRDLRQAAGAAQTWFHENPRAAGAHGAPQAGVPDPP